MPRLRPRQSVEQARDVPVAGGRGRNGRAAEQDLPDDGRPGEEDGPGEGDRGPGDHVPL